MRSINANGNLTVKVKGKLLTFKIDQEIPLPMSLLSNLIVPILIRGWLEAT
ncbi:hypothetical protein P344_04030 [Spiroplasma mirum ATCC 29335]|uniref:Uncharacterized protein n=1 Tax=Spiroplasma mirum ATCC 29335 TaxID=838561 RepID=W6AWM4_9MOLU|nr:hypothetical protein P344_04030 [Spiroplasma mirum ATCC 29335]